MDGPTTLYGPDGNVTRQGNYSEGRQKGAAQIEFTDGRTNSFEYNSGDSTDTCVARERSQILSNEDIEGIKLPTFQGGEAKMMRYLSGVIRYSSDARRSKVQGMVMVTFVVNEEGFLECVKIFDSPNKMLNAESLRAVNGMPRWNPGFKDGVPVAVQYNLPIMFQLR